MSQHKTYMAILEKNTSLFACILEDEKVYWAWGSRYQAHIPNSNSMRLRKRSFKHYFLLHNCLRVRTKVPYISIVHMLAMKNGAIPSDWLPRGPYSSFSLPIFSRQAPPLGRWMAVSEREDEIMVMAYSPLGKSLSFLQGFQV